MKKFLFIFLGIFVFSSVYAFETLLDTRKRLDNVGGINNFNNSAKEFTYQEKGKELLVEEYYFKTSLGKQDVTISAQIPFSVKYLPKHFANEDKCGGVFKLYLDAAGGEESGVLIGVNELKPRVGKEAECVLSTSMPVTIDNPGRHELSLRFVSVCDDIVGSIKDSRLYRVTLMEDNNMCKGGYCTGEYNSASYGYYGSSSYGVNRDSAGYGGYSSGSANYGYGYGSANYGSNHSANYGYGSSNYGYGSSQSY